MITVTVAISAILGALPLALIVKTVRFHRKQRRFFADLDAQFRTDLAALSLAFAVEMLAPPDWRAR